MLEALLVATDAALKRGGISIGAIDLFEVDAAFAPVPPAWFRHIGRAAYAASKAATVEMTLPIARGLMGEGIRVNTIMSRPRLRRLPERRERTAQWEHSYGAAIRERGLLAWLSRLHVVSSLKWLDDGSPELACAFA